MTTEDIEAVNEAMDSITYLNDDEILRLIQQLYHIIEDEEIIYDFYGGVIDTLVQEYQGLLTIDPSLAMSERLFVEQRFNHILPLVTIELSKIMIEHQLTAREARLYLQRARAEAHARGLELEGLGGD
jgi:hypothetical protein